MNEWELAARKALRTKPHIHFSLCTNNPDNGNDTGKVSAVHCGMALELEWGEIGSEPKYSIKDGYLRISRRKFPIIGSREWEGNWCWTGIWMSTEVAAEFLKYLNDDDRWHCEGGWCELSDKFSEGSITAGWLSENHMELEVI